MPIYHDWQHILECDTCGAEISDAHVTQKMVIKKAREYGWKVGEKITCPDCAKKNQAPR